MNNVHPILQQGLAGIAPPSPLTEYHKALASMDWQFEHSDEHAVWARGSNALARLHRMQRDLDPTGEIWMSYPGARGHGAPLPRVRVGGMNTRISEGTESARRILRCAPAGERPVIAAEQTEFKSGITAFEVAVWFIAGTLAVLAITPDLGSLIQWVLK